MIIIMIMLMSDGKKQPRPNGLLWFNPQVVLYTKWSFLTQTTVHFVHKMNTELIHWIAT